MAITAVSEDRIKLEVFGRLTNLPDNDGVSDTVLQATGEVNHIRKWYADASGMTESTGADTDTTDIRWIQLVELKAIRTLIRRFRSPQDAHIYAREHIQPLLGEIAATYSANWGSAFGETESITPGNLRVSIVNSLIRKSEPVFPPIAEIDRTIQMEFIKLWDMRKWKFRRRALWLKIQTDGSVTTAESGIGFDGIASKWFFIKDPSSKVRTKCKSVDSTKFAELMAYYADEDWLTGKPEVFYLQPGGYQEVISWLPEPDKIYNAYASVYLKVPSLGSTNASETGLKQLPMAFRMHLRDRVIASIMHEYGKEGAESNRFANKVEKDYRTLLVEFDDTGADDWNVSDIEANRFTKSFRSNQGRFIGGMG